MKRIKNVKFFIAPLTQNIIDAVIEFTNETGILIGFTVSRRQIDYDRGYAGYTTYEFIKYVKSKNKNIIIERDHSGLNQGNDIYPSWIDNYSMITDAHYQIDIMHIDPWKKFTTFNEGLRETINNILCIYNYNYLTKFEIGTEESLFSYDINTFDDLLREIKYELGENIFSSINYAVIQSGTKLQGIKNIGKFNLEKLQKMIQICNKFGILSKEHNGDYLTNDEIKIRFDNGLDAINIAPEFGVIETEFIIKHIKNDKDFEKIYNICLSGNKWKKWVNINFKPEENKVELIKICGHYHNKDLKSIIRVDDRSIKNKLKNRLEELNSLV